MFGFPKDFDAGRLVGRRLESVTFSENTVHLHFSDACTITADQGVTVRIVRSDSASEPRDEIVPIRESILMSSMGSTIVRTEILGGANLALHLSDGSRITIFEYSDIYECYHIQIGDREWHI